MVAMPSHPHGHPFAAALASLAALAAAQDPAQCLRDLGDPARSEAAEIALVQLGSKAVKPLDDFLLAFDAGADGAQARLRAALRAIDLLGPEAAELQSSLDTLACDPTMPALVEVIWTRGSLAPYSGSQEWSNAFLKVVGGHQDRGRLFPAFQRHAQRVSVPKGGSVEQLLERLQQDRLFEREVVAELLGRSGDRAAVEPLRQRLLDRATEPQGWDSLKHNGFVVPMVDGFRLRAAEALLRLAPDDPRAAVALGMRALLHPHRSVRLAALQALGSLGPFAEEAVPELLQVAHGADPALAAEALKVLGMSGTRAPECLAAAEALAQSRDAEVQKRARSLAARLRAMKVELPPPGTVKTDPALAAAVAALGDAQRGVEAAAKVQAVGASAVPLLRQRLSAEGEQVPDAVLRSLARAGRGLELLARTELREQVMQRHGQNWSAPSMSSSSGGGAVTGLDREVYAELTIGEPATLDGLAAFLLDDNAFVRLQAARRLAARGAEVQKQAAVQQAVLQAARGEHPQQSTFETQRHNRETADSRLDQPIQAAAAAALVGVGLPAAVQQELLPKVLAFEDGEVVASALRRWGTAAGLTALRGALDDERDAVAIAAAEAIGRIGKAAAATVPDLQRVAKDGRPAVAAAASAALRRVQGDGN